MERSPELSKDSTMVVSSRICACSKLSVYSDWMSAQ